MFWQEENVNCGADSPIYKIIRISKRKRLHRCDITDLAMKKLNGLLCATRISISAQIDEPRTLLAHFILVQFIFITQCGLWIYMFWACHCSYISLSLHRHLHIHIYSGDICIYVHTCRAYVLNWRRILLLRSSHQSFQNSVPINLFIYFFRQKETHNATVRQPNMQAYSANTESRTAIVYVMPWQQTTI